MELALPQHEESHVSTSETEEPIVLSEKEVKQGGEPKATAMVLVVSLGLSVLILGGILLFFII